MCFTSVGSTKSIALDIQADKQSKFDKVETLSWSRLHRSGKAPMGWGATMYIVYICNILHSKSPNGRGNYGQPWGISPTGAQTLLCTEADVHSPFPTLPLVQHIYEPSNSASSAQAKYNIVAPSSNLVPDMSVWPPACHRSPCLCRNL